MAWAGDIMEFEYGGRYARARKGRNPEESTCPELATFPQGRQARYSPIKNLEICSQRGNKLNSR